MCGRYSMTSPVEAIRQLFKVSSGLNLEARYNIAPTQDAPVVRLADGGRELALLRWGLVPSWAKDLSIGNRLINARAEGVAAKPSFRAAFKTRRCLVVADGFYEWQRLGKGKQPWRFTLAGGGPFAFAGLWERWGRGEAAVDSFTIVTGEPNALVRPVHDRMPVVLDPADHEAWLAAPPDAALALLRPYPAERMAATPVSERVNSPRNDDAAVIEPVEPAVRPS